MNKTALVVLVLALASSANGMVYSWTDSAGIKHFTNRRDEIPERYRSKAKPLYPEQADLAPVQQNTPPPTVTVVVPAPALQPAVQPLKPQEPTRTPQLVVQPEAPQQVIAPVTGRKIRPRPVNPREE